MSPTLAGLAQVGLLVVALAVCYRPLGDHMARVYTAEGHWKVERALYRIVRVNPDSEQRWTTYAAGVLGFSFVSIVLLYLLQRLQPLLPLDLGRGAVDPGIAFNTAVSFVTNTNWQSYSPEAVLGHTVQMAGLTVQNFVSAAVGMAVAVALVRGFVRARTDRLGNFWVDLTRGVTRVLLPIAFVAAIVLVALGAVMSLARGVQITGVDGVQRTLALAPAASQEVIKELGTNGGGIFNANSSHPFENPNAWTNLFEIFLILLIPVALTRTLGTMVGDRKQGYVLLSVMGLLWGALLTVAWWAESHPNGVASLAAGAAMEGKEVRFGIPSTALFAVSTTGTSTGAVNGMHDSLTGLGGGVTLLNMLLGEVAPGGVGAGLYGILVMAVIAVFLAGLMVGRTPEYLGKKLGRREVTAAAIAMLSMPTVVLVGTGVALLLPSTTGFLNNPGAHGLSEVLYAYASTGNNNGSAFGGLTVTSDFFQSTLGLAMLFGRFLPILAVLALAGSLAQQRKVPPTVGTLPTGSPLFAGMLLGTVVLVAALTFLPALALGPIAEALA
ncbi:K+-transporting ATPase ATPase A chain [Streptoalloteichus tenebrarius]|uniref:Potassium-transporting ATPase potassium-binding subunit n=1 Tax=Streptoalloteichus tenebrarius (strain ATCC 17920 / DSM 40477 / JCM 4838 / CBS 697.72 / NBRC 16177 / NCIMB 11028 / NRRL B-12390 / A12253. 1 / ISP 5477) TaxID=1933 RepID=A0ABT1HZH5_STRSD|nr:potassium-transporting ATPase subunit KdpA [Streptoalloteichus tenebrarius]MCP2260904.1 K+-transporting ATPase ATPase A chain [Streptoalloteichus tenebrarius]BFF03335.1 potassium-transporting ATPase subunit KdpA [Streptoalloteichus tenebrarius]